MPDLDLDKLEVRAQAFVDAERAYNQASRIAMNLEDSKDAERSVKEAREAYNATADAYWQEAQPECILTLFARIRELEGAEAERDEAREDARRVLNASLSSPFWPDALGAALTKTANRPWRDDADTPAQEGKDE